jgi:hypothetical protein
MDVLAAFIPVRRGLVEPDSVTLAAEIVRPDLINP